MKLVTSPDPGYIHKVLVVAHEAGVLRDLEFECLYPFVEDSPLWQSNPLGKVPYLHTDDGEVLYGGLVVCEYLDSLSTGRHLFPQDARRWRALRQMSLGDGLFDAVVHMQLESVRPREDWRIDVLKHDRHKIMAAFDQLERDARTFTSTDFHIGHVCIAGGISYFVSPGPPPRMDPRPNRIVMCQLESGDETYDWRVGHPALSEWYDEITKRPSMNSLAAHEAIGAVDRPAT